MLTITDSQPILLLDQDGASWLGMRMRSYIIARVLLVLAGSSLLLGCGGGDTGAPYVNFTIDSGGVVDSESSHITGSMNTPVNQSSIIGAAVGSQTDASCIPVVSVTSMTQNSAGKWMLAGTENFAGQTTPFDATQN